MAPKKGGNPKAAAAKERKAEAKEIDKAQKVQAAEDAAWTAAGEGAKSKAQAKKEEQARQREEAAAKKAEAKRLAAEEEAAISATKPAKSKAAKPKVTSHQLQLEKEARQREIQKEQEQRRKDQKHMVSEDAYEQLVAAPNMNRTDPDSVEARSVGEALSALNVSENPDEDRHPEKRTKAAFEAFQERELPDLKLEKPGLKQSQYKDMLWKIWQKSPENPMNRVRQ